MTRPRKPWADRATVQAVTHEPRPSGLPEAWAMLAADGPVSLDALAREAMSSAACAGPADTVRAIADALRLMRPDVVTLDGVPLWRGLFNYRWPSDFLLARPEWRKMLDMPTLAALAVGVALWSRLPTADEVAAWMDDDEPVVGEGVG